ncbi:adenosylcobinamide-phosphate synthase CbiB [uncultured Dialister sp.]|uniref:adenosylcobinamide-phosphate synthase CbiB n=1 Tax=uncultured Dialister sp. TaxID=278064 RepID=UPI0025CFEF97|nr:adenosylcobinamide-phosphate synthase CbiB [uncultured Dialister sp.]
MDGLLYSSFYALIPIAALVIDTIYGDPRSDWHPVVLIGKLISFYENKLYPEPKTSNGNMFLRGMVTVLLVLLTVGLITGLLVWLSVKGGILFYAAMGAVILYFTITPRALCRDGMEIYHLLKAGDIVAARKRLSWIVGRDTENLDESDIARGTVETIAENTTDGIISPLFWFLLFGPVGAMVYRAENTMDSMLGYKNDRYLYFGRFAARLDDVLNYIPARITFLLFVASAAILKLDWKNAKKIGLRDAPKHPSPNGGYAEATVAGAMHVRLGGYNYYEGKPEFREYMGDPDTPLKADHIKQAIYMMYGATILFVVLESVLIFFLW